MLRVHIWNPCGQIRVSFLRFFCTAHHKYAVHITQENRMWIREQKRKTVKKKMNFFWQNRMINKRLCLGENIVTQLSALKSNLWCSTKLFWLDFKHIASVVALGVFFDKRVFSPSGPSYEVCVWWCLTLCPYWSATCATRLLCVPNWSHFYLRKAFIYKGNNVVVLTERERGYMVHRTTPALFSARQPSLIELFS